MSIQRLTDRDRLSPLRPMADSAQGESPQTTAIRRDPFQTLFSRALEANTAPTQKDPSQPTTPKAGGTLGTDPDSTKAGVRPTQVERAEFGSPGKHGPLDAETGRYEWWNYAGKIVLDTPGPGEPGKGNNKVLSSAQREALLLLEARYPNWKNGLVYNQIPMTYRDDIDEKAMWDAVAKGDDRVLFDALGIPEEYSDYIPAFARPKPKPNDNDGGSGGGRGPLQPGTRDPVSTKSKA